MHDLLIKNPDDTVRWELDKVSWDEALGILPTDILQGIPDAEWEELKAATWWRVVRSYLLGSQQDTSYTCMLHDLRTYATHPIDSLHRWSIEDIDSLMDHPEEGLWLHVYCTQPDQVFNLR